MKKGRIYLLLTSITSVLFAAMLPLALGIKDPTLIAIAFTSVWFVYATALFVITFLIAGRRNLKKRLKEGINEKWGYS